MKRIAALAALVITLLAVPAATAMASTSGSGHPGYGTPRPIQVACPFPPRFRKGHDSVKVYPKEYARASVKARRGGKPARLRVACPFIPAKPLPRGCKPEILTFDMAAGSSTATEVSGPILAPTQEFSYDGSTYTIMSVNPGADSFTVFRDNFLFVNKGAAITGAVGVMACSR